MYFFRVPETLLQYQTRVAKALVDQYYTGNHVRAIQLLRDYTGCQFGDAVCSLREGVLLKWLIPLDDMETEELGRKLRVGRTWPTLWDHLV